MAKDTRKRFRKCEKCSHSARVNKDSICNKRKPVIITLKKQSECRDFDSWEERKDKGETFGKRNDHDLVMEFSKSPSMGQTVNPDIMAFAVRTYKASEDKPPMGLLDLDFAAEMALMLEDGLNDGKRQPNDWKDLQPTRDNIIDREGAILRHLREYRNAATAKEKMKACARAACDFNILWNWIKRHGVEGLYK